MIVARAIPKITTTSAKPRWLFFFMLLYELVSKLSLHACFKNKGGV
jgi:hypothetical protein